MKEKKTVHVREYLTVLLRRRSVIALCCVILTLIMAFYGIVEGVNVTNTVLHENGFKSFFYFTMVSNVFAAVSAAFVFPFAVEGIRKKRFVMPKWVAILHFAATTSIAVTMVFVLGFMSWVSPSDAFGGSNFVTHVVCPVLIIVSFFNMESGHRFSWKDRLIGIISCTVYSILYFVEVSVIGEANGGWPDIYQVTKYVSPALAIPAFLLLAFGVSTVMALISNFLTKKRNERAFLYWKDVLDPIEVRIEAFGIGRMAAHYDENDITVPYCILSGLAKRYQLDTEDLLKAFAVGLALERKDMEKKKGSADSV